MTATHSPRHDELLPAYALGALDGEELRELAAHREAGCATCDAELRRLAAALEELALDCHEEMVEMEEMAAAAPESLAGEAEALLGGVKRRLLAQVANEPRPARAAGAAGAAAVPPRAIPPAPASSSTPAAAAGAEPLPPPVPFEPGRRRAPVRTAGRWPLLAAAAALAAVAVWGLARQASLGAEIERLRAERRQLAAQTEALARQLWQAQAESDRLAQTLSVIASPGVQSVQLAAMGSSHAAGRAYVNAADRKVAFYASDLPALGPDKTYQLWYLDDEERQNSAGVFSVDPRGRASLVIERPLPVEHIQAWSVTVEPRGGRPQPTGPMVLAG